MIRLCITLFICACANHLFAAVDVSYSNSSAPSEWVLDPEDFHVTKQLPIEDQSIKIRPSEKHIRKRIMSSQSRSDIGAILLNITKKNINKKALLYAHPPSQKTFKKWLQKQLNDKKSALVSLTPETLHWLKLEKISAKYEQNHHKLKLHALPKSKAKSLARSMKPFFSRSQYKALRKTLLSKSTLDVDQYLLPPFARKAVRHFTIFRGPNCFHASLAFQNEKWTQFERLNIRREKNHHKSMINHDELARALQQHFYPVQPPLKYGDLIVFADLPENPQKDLHYRWIKHAATWLFDGYVFSKGSKSPNSPWAVKTFSEEWGRWSKNTKRLGIKAFRRSQERVKKHLPVDPVDWLY